MRTRTDRVQPTTLPSANPVRPTSEQRATVPPRPLFPKRVSPSICLPHSLTHSHTFPLINGELQSREEEAEGEDVASTKVRMERREKKTEKESESERERRRGSPVHWTAGESSSRFRQTLQNFRLKWPVSDQQWVAGSCRRKAAQL